MWGNSFILKIAEQEKRMENFDIKKAPFVKKAVSVEGFVFMLGFAAFFAVVGGIMGGVNMLNTIMLTAYELLIGTVFYIMAVAIIAGAIAELFVEFGVVSATNKMLSGAVRIIYGMPGASIVGIFATYFSDNPAILTLADNEKFKAYFKKYQMPALTNVGTSFGMGLIVSAFIAGIVSPTGETFILPLIIGNIGAFIGSIVSVRLMLLYTVRLFGKTQEAVTEAGMEFDFINLRIVREGSPPNRFMEALLEGGKRGVGMGLAIAPGVLVICTLILILTNGASSSGAYTGAAFEGIGFIPAIGERLSFIIDPLFGFSDPKAIAVPLTAIGASGAAIGLIPGLVADGVAGPRDIAVFVAMCMCWSGYMSTHIAMMENLGFRSLAGKAILCHTVAGLCAGISANIIYGLYMLV